MAAVPKSDTLPMQASSSNLIQFPCPICAGKSFSVWREDTIGAGEVSGADLACTSLSHGKHFRIVECSDCRMRYCSPRPSERDLLNLYEFIEDHLYVAEENGRRLTFENLISSFKRKQGRLLDIGAGSGVFLEVARRHGFDVYGIEPSRYASQHARETRKIDVMQGSFPTELPWPFPFDVVSAWDVIEHVSEPKRFVRCVYDRLAIGGEFHFSTIFYDSLVARCLMGSWPWLMPMHIHYFSRRTISRLLRDEGFQKVTFHRYKHIISRDYLCAKLNRLRPSLRLLGKLAMPMCAVSQKHVGVALGDVLHVTATK